MHGGDKSKQLGTTYKDPANDNKQSQLKQEGKLEPTDEDEDDDLDPEDRIKLMLEQFNYMRERPEYFRGVVVAKRYLRRYPHADLAAQLFGTVSEITEDQLKQPRYEGVEQGTRIGQSGLEEQYDKYLRGVDGSSSIFDRSRFTCTARVFVSPT